MSFYGVEWGMGLVTFGAWFASLQNRENEAHLLLPLDLSE